MHPAWNSQENTKKNTENYTTNTDEYTEKCTEQYRKIHSNTQRNIQENTRERASKTLLLTTCWQLGCSWPSKWWCWWRPLGKQYIHSKTQSIYTQIAICIQPSTHESKDHAHAKNRTKAYGSLAAMAEEVDDDDVDAAWAWCWLCTCAPELPTRAFAYTGGSLLNTVCTCMYVCMRISLCVCVHAHIHIHVFIYII